MFSKWLWLTTAFLFICTSMLIPAETVAAETQLRSAGCKTEFFLLENLSEAYHEKYGTKLRTAKTGNKKAVNLLLDGSVDFTYTCKPINMLSKKLQLDSDRVGHWKSIPIAKDPIVVVSHSENGVKNLSVEQLTNVFNGTSANWQDVGGRDTSINVAYLNPELESGSLLLFKEFTVGAKGSLTADAKLLEGPAMLGTYVSRTPGGVTFMSLTSYQPEYGEIVAIADVLPSKQSILDGSYRLSATYYLTLDGREDEAIEAFVAFCKSDEGRQVIARNFIPYTE